MPAEASLPLRAAAWGRASQPISGALFLVGREILQLFLVLLIDPSSRLRQPLDEGAPVLHANGASSLHCLTSPTNGIDQNWQPELTKIGNHPRGKIPA